MTSRPHTPRNRRMARLAACAVSVTAAAALTACGTGSDEDAKNGSDTTASPTPTGAVTTAEAEKILDAYEKVNNKANIGRDARLLGTVEAGQVYEQSTADYKLSATWSKQEQADYKKPFTYKNRKYYIPAGEDWFAAKVRASGSKDDALLVFAKVDGRFKVVYAVYSDAPIPEIDTSRHGLATVVDPSAAVGALAPDQLSAAYEDLFESGGKKAGGKLATTETSKAAIKLYQDRTKGDRARWATKNFFSKEPAFKSVYALRLADGGVISVFPTAHNQETLLKPQYRSSFQITPNDEESVFDSTKRVVVTDNFQGQAMATLHPSKKPDVIAAEYRMVNSR
ncbi:hypothetical protein ABZ915_43265 [Streptomyces sp. NPDC046915]|uniref:hypothetical protein n=1 Tax=Streptomyces sp. NPDC046915 TaxID=3155257 RepID=UPI0033DC8591